MNEDDDKQGLLARIFGAGREAWRGLRSNPVSEIGASFVPGVGTAMDVEDLASGVADRDAGKALMAMAGLFTPFAGSQIKAAKSGIGSALDAARRGTDVLPPASSSMRTQRGNTIPTYVAAGELLDELGATGRSLDYAAGLGLGARRIGFDETFEPFPQKGFVPTYIRPEEIPESAYGRLTSLNALNVMTREPRDEAVENIGRILEPGGYGVITARSTFPKSTIARATPGPEPNSYIMAPHAGGESTYQKGFSNQELEDYLKYILGENFEVGRRKVGAAPSSALIRRIR